MLAVLFPHMYEDVEYLIPEDELGRVEDVEMVDGTTSSSNAPSDPRPPTGSRRMLRQDPLVWPGSGSLFALSTSHGLSFVAAHPHSLDAHAHDTRYSGTECYQIHRRYMLLGAEPLGG